LLSEAYSRWRLHDHGLVVMNKKKWTKRISLFVFSVVMILSVYVLWQAVEVINDVDELLDWMGTIEVR
jgi:hypothetical protein